MGIIYQVKGTTDARNTSLEELLTVSPLKLFIDCRHWLAKIKIQPWLWKQRLISTDGENKQNVLCIPQALRIEMEA